MFQMQVSVLVTRNETRRVALLDPSWASQCQAFKQSEVALTYCCSVRDLDDTPRFPHYWPVAWQVMFT
jgi:hypothetical protein